MDKNIWTKKGATLSHKNAMKEYQLSEQELIKALNEGELQYKINYVHGNPYYKLIRREVEELVESKGGKIYLDKIKFEARLREIETEIRKRKREIKKLEKEKDDIQNQLNSK